MKLKAGYIVKYDSREFIVVTELGNGKFGILEPETLEEHEVGEGDVEIVDTVEYDDEPLLLTEGKINNLIISNKPSKTLFSLSPRPERKEVINGDDILNLKIELGIATDVNDFIERM